MACRAPRRSPPFGAYAGKSVFQLTVYANAGGETLSFKFHDGASTADMAETVAFVVNGNQGSVTSPIALSGTAAAAPPPATVSWSVVASDFSDTMTLTAMVTVDGVDQASGTLGAFVGSQVRGVQSTPSSPPFGAYAGKSVFQLTVYANAGGETVSFKFHDGASTADMAETLAFVVNGNQGSVTSPIALTGTVRRLTAPPPPAATSPPTTVPTASAPLLAPDDATLDAALPTALVRHDYHPAALGRRQCVHVG